MPSDKGYNSKQMGDACEMLVAGELTLAGVPAVKMPDNWPGYDVLAQLGRQPQRVSVKSATEGSNTFIAFDPEDFDWLAVVILLPGGSRQFYVIPKFVAAAKSDPRSDEQQARVRGPRRLFLNKRFEKEFAQYRGNFRLERRPKASS